MDNKTNALDLTTIQALAIDMDGVLWRGNTPLPGFAKFFDFLHEQKLRYTLVSNNSTKTPDQYQQKLADLGATVGRESLLTSSLATAEYMKGQFQPGSAVYVVGQDGLHYAMTEAGFVLVPDSSEPADVVVAGLDMHITYEKLRHATLLIRRGAKYIGTNGDLTFPSEEGLLPGAGSILAAIEAATSVAPVVVGKPKRLMFDIAVAKMGVEPEHTAMIGDRLETDILGGQRAGLKTILVTTGVDNEAAIPQKGIVPDLVFTGIEALVDTWQALL
jgi:4-nitrophenyl phosphatase